MRVTNIATVVCLGIWISVMVFPMAYAQDVQKITIIDGGNLTEVMLPGLVDDIYPLSENLSENNPSVSGINLKSSSMSSRESSTLPRSGIEWENVLGASYSEEFASIHETSDGGYIACGMTDAYYANGDVNPPQFIGNGDAWVVKLDSSGKPVWQNVFGGRKRDECRSIRQTTDGGYVFVGFSNTSFGDTVPNARDYDIYVVRLDPTGHVLWQQFLGGPNTDVGTSIRETSDGGYILTGFEDFSSTRSICKFSEQTNAWVMKLRPDGTLDWQKKMAGDLGSHGTSIIEARDGDYVLYGFTSSTSGDGISGNHGVDDLWVVKMDPTGQIIRWSGLYGGSGFEATSHVTDDGIEQTSDGGFVLVGQETSGSGEDESGEYEINNHGRSDTWIVKLTPRGSIQWQKAIGGEGDEIGGRIHQTEDGGYIVAARTDSSKSGDVGLNHGDWDFWVAKLDKPSIDKDGRYHAGEILWQDVLGGDDSEQCESMEPTRDGGYILSGRTTSNDSGDVGQNNGGSGDAWVVKLTPRYVAKVMDTDTRTFIPNGTVEMFDFANNRSLNIFVKNGPVVFTDSPGPNPFTLQNGNVYRLSVNATGYPPVKSNVTYLLTNQSVDLWLMPTDRPTIGKTFSITNAWVKPQENPPFEPNFDSKKYIENLNRELKNEGWVQVYPEINGTNIKKAQFGVYPTSPDRTINDATLHWHIGHGTGKLNGTHTSLALPKTYNSSSGDFDYDFLTPSEVTTKWGGNNKWVVLLSCWILQDADWGSVLGTSHGIFGFTTPTDVKSELPSKFLQYAKSGETLYDSWYDATYELYRSDVVGTEFIIGQDGKARVDNHNHTVNVSAAVRFKTQEQLLKDHLPGIGKYIAPDDDLNNSSSFGNKWDCHTGERVNL